MQEDSVKISLLYKNEVTIVDIKYSDITLRSLSSLAQSCYKDALPGKFGFQFKNLNNQNQNSNATDEESLKRILKGFGTFKSGIPIEIINTDQSILVNSGSSVVISFEGSYVESQSRKQNPLPSLFEHLQGTEKLQMPQRQFSTRTEESIMQDEFSEKSANSTLVRNISNQSSSTNQVKSQYLSSYKNQAQSDENFGSEQSKSSCDTENEMKQFAQKICNAILIPEFKLVDQLSEKYQQLYQCNKPEPQILKCLCCDISLSINTTYYTCQVCSFFYLCSKCEEICPHKHALLKINPYSFPMVKAQKKEKKAKKMMDSRVKEITVNNQMKYQSHEQVTKIFSICNKGLKSWPADTQLVLLSQEPYVSFFPIKMEKVMLPGQKKELTISVAAPDMPGTHCLVFRLVCTKKGITKAFGMRIFFQFDVISNKLPVSQNLIPAVEQCQQFNSPVYEEWEQKKVEYMMKLQSMINLSIIKEQKLIWLMNQEMLDFDRNMHLLKVCKDDERLVHSILLKEGKKQL